MSFWSRFILSPPLCHQASDFWVLPRLLYSDYQSESICLSTFCCCNKIPELGHSKRKKNLFSLWLYRLRIVKKKKWIVIFSASSRGLELSHLFVGWDKFSEYTARCGRLLRRTLSSTCCVFLRKKAEGKVGINGKESK